MNSLLLETPAVLTYDLQTGEVRFKRNNRKLFPDYDGLSTVWIPHKQKLLKIKHSKLCLFLATARVLNADERILHRNLDSNDTKLSNLVIVPRAKFLEIKEAILNVTQHLRIVPHSKDQYQFCVQYRKSKQQQQIICDDILAAKAEERKLRLGLLKLITAYCAET
jgi:hypothetical protein